MATRRMTLDTKYKDEKFEAKSRKRERSRYPGPSPGPASWGRAGDPGPRVRASKSEWAGTGHCGIDPAGDTERSNDVGDSPEQNRRDTTASRPCEIG